MAMTDKRKFTSATSRRPVALRAHPVRLVRSFKELLEELSTTQPRLISSELRKWKQKLDPKFRPVATRMYFGSIVWPRNFALPGVDELHRAFRIEHLRRQEFLSYEPNGGSRWVKLSAPYEPSPPSWDGPLDAEELRVTFAVLIGEEPEQYVRVSAADGVAWRRPDGSVIGEIRVEPSRVSLTPGLGPRKLPPMRIFIR